MRRFSYLAAFILTLFILPACETVEGLKDDIGSIGMPEVAALGQKKTALHTTCPEVHIVDELASITEFTKRNSTSSSDLVTKVDISALESTCARGEKSISVDLKLAFQGHLGPQGRARGNDVPFFSHPYFVAITAPNGDILAKEVFAASINYEPGEDTHTYHESLRQIIPVKYETTAPRYKVLVGFQLNNDQLAYNREQIKLAKEAERKGTPLGSIFSPAEVAAPAASNTNGSVTVYPLGGGQPTNAPIDLTTPVQK